MTLVKMRKECNDNEVHSSKYFVDTDMCMMCHYEKDKQSRDAHESKKLEEQNDQITKGDKMHVLPRPIPENKTKEVTELEIRALVMFEIMLRVNTWSKSMIQEWIKDYKEKRGDND